METLGASHHPTRGDSGILRQINASCTNDSIVGREPLLHLMGVLMILEWFVYIALLHSLPNLPYSPLLRFVEGGPSVDL